jgi:hypothetical protein
MLGLIVVKKFGMSNKRSVYILPSNTEIWSIDLQETIEFNRDIYVSISHTTTLKDYVYVKKMIRIENLTLSQTTNTDCSSYMLTKHEFGVPLSKLKFVKQIDLNI